MYQDYLEINNSVIPIKVHYHRKSKLSGKLTSDHAILHLPKHTTPQQQVRQIENFKTFLVESLKNKPDLLETFELKPFSNGDQIEVRSNVYDLKISTTHQKSNKAALQGQTISLVVNDNQHPFMVCMTIKTLLSRIFAKVYLPTVKDKVNQLNNQHYKVLINDVRLKYNRSNWGSCSSKGNINLSTRLLMAPDIVLDYVIIHELAHRIEPNHSSQFWKVVREAMPNYQKQELWLKKHGASCDFNPTN